MDKKQGSAFLTIGRLHLIMTSMFNFYLILFMFLINSQFIFSKTIILAAAENSIPTTYVENGRKTGILTEIINEAFKRIGYSVEIELMPWARCLEEVEKGTVDGIFSVFITEDRKTFLTYTTEILITQVQAFFVLKNSNITFDGDLNKLSDKTIGVITKTSYGPRLDTALKDKLFKKIDLSPFSQSNVKKLLTKRVDLIPSYRHIVLSTAKELGELDNIKELSPEIESIPSYLAFTKKRNFSNIIKSYNKALKEMKKDGTYDKIFKKYLE